MGEDSSVALPRGTETLSWGHRPYQDSRPGATPLSARARSWDLPYTTPVSPPGQIARHLPLQSGASQPNSRVNTFSGKETSSPTTHRDLCLHSHRHVPGTAPTSSPRPPGSRTPTAPPSTGAGSLTPHTAVPYTYPDPRHEPRPGAVPQTPVPRRFGRRPNPHRSPASSGSGSEPPSQSPGPEHSSCRRHAPVLAPRSRGPALHVPPSASEVQPLDSSSAARCLARPCLSSPDRERPA